MTNPIRLGALAPLSRPGFLEAGRHLLAGIELAVSEINDRGGVDDRPIELLVRDTAGTPQRGADAIREFAEAGAVAAVGEYHSVVAQAAAHAAVACRLPFVCSSAVLDALVDEPTDLVSRIAPAQSYCWRVYADYLVSAGYRHVALAIEPNPYWSAGAEILRTALAERGVRVTEMDDEAEILLLLVGYPEPAASIVEGVRTGMRIGDPAGRAEFPEWRELLGARGADVPYLSYFPEKFGPLGWHVEERLAQVLGERPSFVGFEGYDAVQVALGGAEVAGTRGTISFARTAGPVRQWQWPPVQVALSAGE